MRIHNKLIAPFAIAAGLMISLTACETTSHGLDVAESGHNAEVSTSSAISLYDHQWLLVTLNGQKVGKGEGGNLLSLSLSSDNNKATGFAGCNNYFSIFSVDNQQITFGALAMTRKYCSKYSELESGFSKALNNVTSYVIEGEKLHLSDKNKAVLATLSRG